MATPDLKQLLAEYRLVGRDPFQWKAFTLGPHPYWFSHSGFPLSNKELHTFCWRSGKQMRSNKRRACFELAQDKVWLKTKEAGLRDLLQKRLRSLARGSGTVSAWGLGLSSFSGVPAIGETVFGRRAECVPGPFTIPLKVVFFASKS